MVAAIFHHGGISINILVSYDGAQFTVAKKPYKLDRPAPLAIMW